MYEAYWAVLLGSFIGPSGTIDFTSIALSRVLNIVKWKLRQMNFALHGHLMTVLSAKSRQISTALYFIAVRDEHIDNVVLSKI